MAQPTVVALLLVDGPSLYRKAKHEEQGSSSTPPWPCFSSRIWALALTSFNNYCGLEMSTKQPPSIVSQGVSSQLDADRGLVAKTQQCNNTGENNDWELWCRMETMPEHHRLDGAEIRLKGIQTFWIQQKNAKATNKQTPKESHKQAKESPQDRLQARCKNKKKNFYTDPLEKHQLATVKHGGSLSGLEVCN